MNEPKGKAIALITDNDGQQKLVYAGGYSVRVEDNDAHSKQEERTNSPHLCRAYNILHLN